MRRGEGPARQAGPTGWFKARQYTGLVRIEQPLLKAREGPILDGDGENEPAQQVAEVIGDDAEEQPHLVGSEPVAREPGAVAASLPPSIHCSAAPRWL